VAQHRPWNRAESIAGLWAYEKAYGREVSRSAGSPVAIVAERIGRAVTGVYNKVMNFRHLDPRDARKGLTGGGKADDAVWAEFFDDETKELRIDALNVAFERLWPAGSADQPETVTDEELVSVTSGRGGQGFINDPQLRKAIEDRAMEAALEYYRSRFSLVEDTSRSEPYDLRATADDLEVRVEVKGSTGAGTDILLTMGEVTNARGDRWRTDLFLVTNIRVTQSPDGPQAHGGDVRIIKGWIPLDEHLKATVYRYRVPG
jgi:Protein NO VEIN, C-terminal